MAILDIPKGPEALSSEWLTAALQSGGATNARVASFEYEPIAAGVGFLGKLGRLRLRYAEDGEGLPRTLVVKQPTQDAKSRQLAMMFRLLLSRGRIRRRYSDPDCAFRRRRRQKRRLRAADGGPGASAGR
jgi:hypothetical protein